jgi:hypothetical protein
LTCEIFFIFSKVLGKETADAVASDQWLHISSECVQEFLRMACLGLGESDLVRALIRWGKYQVQIDEEDPTDGQKLRSKILPALKLIKFAAMTHKEFAQLCLEELGVVINLEEKYSIMMAIATGEWKLVPSELLGYSDATPRKQPFTSLQIEFEELQLSRSFALICMDGSQPKGPSLIFQLDKGVDFVGLKLNTLNSSFDDFSFELSVADSDTIMGKGGVTGEKIIFENEDFFQVTPKCNLLADIRYRLRVTASSFSSIYILPSEKIATTSDGLTLQIHFQQPLHVNLEKILFLTSSL